MALFNQKDMQGFNKIFRINLMNSLSDYKPANLIGTISKEGIENVAIFSSVVHLGSNPPLLGFIVRPTVVPRNTYTNIKSTKYFTINHIAEPMIKDAHHTSAKYDESISEFDVTNLTSNYIDSFKAPFVAESPVNIGLKYVEEYFISANNTILVVGEIMFFNVKDRLLQEDGFLNLSKGSVATINGLDGYAVPNLHLRETYQRPKT